MATTSSVHDRLQCPVAVGVEDTNASLQESHGCSSCLISGSLITRSGSVRKPERYAPYHYSNSTRLHRQQQQLVTHNVDTSDCPHVQRRRVMLRLAIALANSSLESTLQHFNTACHAHPGSAAAIAALDAAEAAMAHTTRMTSIASVLARCCLQSSGAVDADPLLLQQAQQLALQTLLPAGQQPVLMQQGIDAGLAAVAAQAPAAMCWFAPPQQQQAEEEVEEGEEVSSSCTCSTSVRL